MALSIGFEGLSSIWLNALRYCAYQFPRTPREQPAGLLTTFAVLPALRLSAQNPREHSVNPAFPLA